MTDLVLNVRVDGGIEVTIGAENTRVRAIRANIMGAMHIRILRREPMLYSVWVSEYAKSLKDPSVIAERNISIVVGVDTWVFEGCHPTAVSADGLDIVLEFDTPKKNGRTIYAKIDDL